MKAGANHQHWALATAVLVVFVMPVPLGVHAATQFGECFSDPSTSGPLSGRTIIVDPGHGGSDPGAVNTATDPDLVEKTLNLEISTILKDLLVAEGARVCLTRTGDETLSNADRYTFANAHGGHALVSIHLNSVSDPNVDYTMTMWGKREKDLALAQAVLPALVSGLATFPDGTDSPIDSGRVAQFASGVLLKSNMPAIIVEGVFMSNTAEASYLADSTQGRETQIAEAIRDGLVAFFQQQGGSDGGGGKGNGKGGGKP
uniref:N-acetylmuramoyl-L-alanine amidase n=1 Tax=Thermorudis peleae TaxID=1382356 RepID=A0A831TF44_9BACT